MGVPLVENLMHVHKVSFPARVGVPAGENLPSSEGKFNRQERTSAQHTADVVGTSRAKVEKARTVLDKATDEVKRAGKELGSGCANWRIHGTPTRAAQLGLNDPAWAKLREAEYAAFVLELQKNREAIAENTQAVKEGAKRSAGTVSLRPAAGGICAARGRGQIW